MNKTGPIIIIEDDIDDQEILEDIFRELNYLNKLIFFGDSQEALDFLIQTEIEPFLVISDINMPKLSGLEVLSEMKKHPATRHVPVVLLTSSTLQEEMLRAYVEGANSFLQKPVDFDQFDELIRHVGFYWTHLNKNPDEITLVAEIKGDQEEILTAV